MGWFSIDKEDNILREETDGRPVQAGEEGKLKFIGQEDFGHKVGIDLVAGVIILDYDEINIQNGTIEIHNPRSIIYLCDETNIIGELLDVKRARGRPTKEGVVRQTITPMEWRPIWFTRHTNENITKVIGAQTTLTKHFGGKNIKKMISLFEDGRVGIS